MPPGNGYDQHLRAIGQSLDNKRITAFELKADAERYVVRGIPEKDSRLLPRLRDWRNRMQGASKETSLVFGTADIDRLDNEGRLNRTKRHRLPDFYSLPNTLRTVGSYLDSKNAELLELHKSPLSVTLLYQNENGHPNMEERSIASFYNLFVALHGKRKDK
ncbi:MAG TPA: hypothetical protein VF089_01535 [Candidatus Binatia bacterium]